MTQPRAPKGRWGRRHLEQLSKRCFLNPFSITQIYGLAQKDWHLQSHPQSGIMVSFFNMSNPTSHKNCHLWPHVPLGVTNPAAWPRLDWPWSHLWRCLATWLTRARGILRGTSTPTYRKDQENIILRSIRSISRILHVLPLISNPLPTCSYSKPIKAPSTRKNAASAPLGLWHGLAWNAKLGALLSPWQPWRRRLTRRTLWAWKEVHKLLLKGQFQVVLAEPSLTCSFWRGHDCCWHPLPDAPKKMFTACACRMFQLLRGIMGAVLQALTRCQVHSNQGNTMQHPCWIWFCNSGLPGSPSHPGQLSAWPLFLSSLSSFSPLPVLNKLANSNHGWNKHSLKGYTSQVIITMVSTC